MTTIPQENFKELMESFLNLPERPSEEELISFFKPAIVGNYSPSEADKYYLLSLWDRRHKVILAIQSFFCNVSKTFMGEGFEVVRSNYQLKIAKGALQFSINAVRDVSEVPETVPGWAIGGFYNLPAAWWIEGATDNFDELVNITQQIIEAAAK